jgi:hypothetical protein
MGLEKYFSKISKGIGKAIGIVSLTAFLTSCPPIPPGPKQYIVGEKGPAGGWVFYDKGDYADGWRYLETAPNDQISTIWGTYDFTVSGADGTAIGTGKQNTVDIIAGDFAINKAADECADYSITFEGVTYDDWFLPSKDELNNIAIHLYNEGIGNFADDVYWSSSEYSNKSACCTSFSAGISMNNSKTDNHCVRAVREF